MGQPILATYLHLGLALRIAPVAIHIVAVVAEFTVFLYPVTAAIGFNSVQASLAGVATDHRARRATLTLGMNRRVGHHARFLIAGIQSAIDVIVDFRRLAADAALAGIAAFLAVAENPVIAR